MNGKVFGNVRWSYLFILLLLFSVILCVFKMIAVSKNPESFEESASQIPKDKIVLYYASWCGWCKKFLPVWKDFEKQSQSEFPNLIVETVQCDGENAAKCEAADIPGFPTVIYYKNNQKINFKDQRTVKDLINFVKNN